MKEAWIATLKGSLVQTDLREKYAIGHLIGMGNFAKVHTCRSKLDQQTYALKSTEKALIRKNKRNSTSIVSEIEILRRLSHPHVIRLVEVFESDKYIHLVLEYLQGGELFERIKSKGL